MVFSFYRAVQSDRLSAIFVGLAWGLLTVVLQYTAVRMSGAIESLIAGTPTRLSSTAFVDSFALLSIALSTIVLGGCFLLGIQVRSLALTMGGVATSIMGFYVAALALNYKSLNVHIARDVSAGEEAVGVITFLIVLVMRIVPMIFGIGSTLATLGLAGAFFFYLRGEQQLPLPPHGAFGEVDPLASLIPTGPDAWMWIISSISLVPLSSYLMFIFYYIALDVIRSILAIPGRLDRLIKGD